MGDLAAACDVVFPAVDASGSDAVLADARLFISQIALMNEDAKWVDLTLDPDTIWQTDNVALLDFENGSGSCSASGTAEMNDVVKGELPDGEYEGVRFTVGVPFELNHLNDATAPAPLNSPGMFWQWQDGYKFLRVDFLPVGGDRWNVHLGSRACDNAENPNSVPPAGECGRSNRGWVELPNYSLGTPIRMDLSQLVAGADLSCNVDMSPPGCMSAPAEGIDCSPVFGALGLDFERGDCVDSCQGQTVFSL